MHDKSFPIAVSLMLAGLIYTGQNSWTGSAKDNSDINRISLAGFGLSEITRPERLTELSTGSEGPAGVIKRSFGKKVQAKQFQSIIVDENNIKWFLTEAGIVSFDGKKWSLQNKNKQMTQTGIRDIEYLKTPSGRKIWLATQAGATLTSIPAGKKGPADTFTAENSPLLSNNVLSIAAGSNLLSWIGTDKGISAIRDNKWLDIAYMEQYPRELFKEHPITALATTTDGDSLYVATVGLGVIRVFRNEVDAISGASDYAAWGPIYMPSDNVYSICITPDGTQWFGTDNGVARHTGFKTLVNWTVFDMKSGLVNNFVQAIAVDKKGTLWFGTKGGVSAFDGSTWTTITEMEGLNSNNVLCIAVDNDGVVWLGTDNGVTSINNGEYTNFN